MASIEINQKINQWSGFNPEAVRAPSGSSGGDNPSYPYRDEEASSDASRKRRQAPAREAGAVTAGLAPVRNAGVGGVAKGGRRVGRTSASSGSTIVAAKNMGQGFVYTRTRGGNATVKLTMEPPSTGVLAPGVEPRRSGVGLPPIPGANTAANIAAGGAQDPNDDSDQLDLNIFQSLRAPSQVCVGPEFK